MSSNTCVCFIGQIALTPEEVAASMDGLARQYEMAMEEGEFGWAHHYVKMMDRIIFSARHKFCWDQGVEGVINGIVGDKCQQVTWHDILPVFISTEYVRFEMPWERQETGWLKCWAGQPGVYCYYEKMRPMREDNNCIV